MFESPRRLMASVLLAAPLLLAACASSGANGRPLSGTGQETFASPEEALGALLAAARVNDRQRIEAIFGAENVELLDSGDASAQALARQEFCAAADELTVLEPVGEDTVEVILGAAGWPAPVPLVRADGRWYFDTEAGIEEILNRRIGRNELEAINLCRNYVDAQHIYRLRDWDGDGVREYAQQLLSTPGQYDGLYWAYDEAGEMPLCPLDGMITENEAYIEGREAGSPWFGYYAKILTRQGPAAPGGAVEYLDANGMTAGFALIAWPAQPGLTGVMSFLVSHHGTVYEQDLGSASGAAAAALEAFDPSTGWTPVE